MPSRKLVLMMVVCVTALSVAIASPVAAASKPSIRGVALYSGDEFGAVRIAVFGAKSVVVCVSRKCKPAFKSSVAGLWTSPASGLPTLRKGQSREVIVFAAAAGGGVSYLVKRAVVK
jgi:hypothetical protein